MDKDLQNHYLQELNKTEGWKLVREHIRTRMKSIEIRMVTTEFTNLQEIALLQGEYKALKSIYNQFNI